MSETVLLSRCLFADFKMDSQVFKVFSEMVGLPKSLQNTLALTVEENWNLGLFHEIIENPNG